MAGGLVHIWNEWAIQILVVLSFALQNFLFVFARTCRRGSSTVLRILIWLAYLMAESTAVYTLGHLSINGSLGKEKLVIFWAPFLLVHLGSQDSITAYALEDNQLWPRHLLNLGVQAIGITYIVYKHIAEIPTLLGFATILMSIVGVIKYGERIWALKCANLDSIRTSIRFPPYFPTYFDVLPSQKAKAQERDEEELLLFAQAMLPICKSAIINCPLVLTSRPTFRFRYWNSTWNWKATFKVVSMELSLMYDILYTKAAVIHTWYGYCIRVFSPLATVASFILFDLSDKKNGYNRADVAITYILLVGAFLMDMVSVFSTLGSTWTCNFLWTRGWSKLGNVILLLRQHVKAARSSRGWSGCIGQYNLFHSCSNDITRMNLVAMLIGLSDWWDKWHYSETIVISEDVKELLFKRVWKLVKEIHQPGGEDQIWFTPYEEGMGEESMAMMPLAKESARFRRESYYDTARRRKKLDDALNFGVELQEAILTWHVFTNVFVLRSDTPKDASSSAYMKAIKALSDYMVFLIVVHPNTIPGFELRDLFQATSIALVSQRAGAGPSSGERVAKIANVLHNSMGSERGMTNIILSHGALYARLLLKLADTGNPEKLGIIFHYVQEYRVAMDKLKSLMPDLESSCRDGEFDMSKALVLILDTWVRLLIWASMRCSREAHARQISRGSELMTVVWLMEEHASVFFNGDTSLFP